MTPPIGPGSPNPRGADPRWENWELVSWRSPLGSGKMWTLRRRRADPGPRVPGAAMYVATSRVRVSATTPGSSATSIALHAEAARRCGIVCTALTRLHVGSARQAPTASSRAGPVPSIGLSVAHVDEYWLFFGHGAHLIQHGWARSAVQSLRCVFRRIAPPLRERGFE